MDNIQSYCAINILTESGFVKGNPIPVPKDPSILRSAELISLLFHQLLMDPSDIEAFDVVTVTKDVENEWNQKPIYIVTMNPNATAFDSEEDAFGYAGDLADRITGYDSNHPLPMQEDDASSVEEDATLPYRLVFNGVIVQLNLDIEPEFSREFNDTPRNINQLVNSIFEQIGCAYLREDFILAIGGFKQTLAEGMIPAYEIKIHQKLYPRIDSGPLLTAAMENSRFCIRM